MLARVMLIFMLVRVVSVRALYFYQCRESCYHSYFLICYVLSCATLRVPYEVQRFALLSRALRSATYSNSITQHGPTEVYLKILLLC